MKKNLRKKRREKEDAKFKKWEEEKEKLEAEISKK